MQPVWDDSTTLAPLLWIALGLFTARVVGQLLVVTVAPRWLPPMDQWQSGLLPYRVLLASQLVIIALMALISYQFTVGEGALVESAPRAGRVVFAIGWVYLGGMVFRYCWSMWRHPERRWLGDTIPIVFHCVLASFLLVVGGFQVLGH